MLTVGSLFSGVGGFEQGFEAAGFRTAWQCEIDPDATSVLERHYPNVRRFRDVREIDPAGLEPVDVVVFGSPCQDMSVAGKRGGLAGERSGLFHEAVRIISGLRSAPSMVVWENVPGALSSSGGRDFGAVLDALADIGALDISWRVLDAQWWGVPQRRRRIFLVADFGGERAASVLFESESVRGDSQAGREARQGAARDAENGAGSGGVDTYSIAYGFRPRDNGYRPDVSEVNSPAYCVDTFGEHAVGVFPKATVSGEAVRDCLTAHGGSHGRIDAESETFVVAAFDERQITSKANRSTVERGAVCPTLNGSGGMSVTHALTTRSGATEDGTGRGTPLAASPGGTSVRRLTPRECERLMGWPDDHTRWRGDGREIPDGPRYRMCGNGVVAPVAFWIARRLRSALEVG